MGFTKKQRREQKKHAAAQVMHAKKRKPQRREISEQPVAIDQSVATGLPEHPMILVKSSWDEPDRDSQQSFQLIELAANQSQEEIHQRMLDRLQNRGLKNCVVELFDPDNVPPDTLPAGARITLGEPLLDY